MDRFITPILIWSFVLEHLYTAKLILSLLLLVMLVLPLQALDIEPTAPFPIYESKNPEDTYLPWWHKIQDYTSGIRCLYCLLFEQLKRFSDTWSACIGLFSMYSVVVFSMNLNMTYFGAHSFDWLDPSKIPGCSSVTIAHKWPSLN